MPPTPTESLPWQQEQPHGIALEAEAAHQWTLHCCCKSKSWEGKAYGGSRSSTIRDCFGVPSMNKTPVLPVPTPLKAVPPHHPCFQKMPSRHLASLPQQFAQDASSACYTSGNNPTVHHILVPAGLGRIKYGRSIKSSNY